MKTGIKITVDEFLTSTRVSICHNTRCKYIFKHAFCGFKIIKIGKDGKCLYFEEENE